MKCQHKKVALLCFSRNRDLAFGKTTLYLWVPVRSFLLRLCALQITIAFQQHTQQEQSLARGTNSVKMT
jgi:hypothetical protein